jgi:amino acid transporter
MSTVPQNAPVYPPGTPIAQPLVAGQPAMLTQPGIAPQQVVVQPVETPAQMHADAKRREKAEEVFIYSHSNFFYWWPVWVVGYIMAAITRLGGDQVNIGGSMEWVHPSKNLGVIFTLTFFLVILITNVTVRGLSSVVVILLIALGVLLVAYMGWWEQLATWFNLISIHMNLGFYVCFSTLIFIVWFISVFIYDRMSYWRVTPGQITHDFLIGGAAKSYDTRGMVFEKRRNDLFRHWILGMGSGDVNMSTTGAKKENIYIPNVLFVDTKIGRIQKMIAMQPDQFVGPSV